MKLSNGQTRVLPLVDDVSTTLFTKKSKSSSLLTSSSSSSLSSPSSVSAATHVSEQEMAANVKNFKGKCFYFFFLVKLTLVSACFAMFFLLMSDVFDKYRNRFTNTAIRFVHIDQLPDGAMRKVLTRKVIILMFSLHCV